MLSHALHASHFLLATFLFTSVSFSSFAIIRDDDRDPAPAPAAGAGDLGPSSEWGTLDGWHDLPPELRGELFLYLSPGDIRDFSLVCCSWFHTAQDSHLRKVYCRTHFAGDESAETIIRPFLDEDGALPLTLFHVLPVLLAQDKSDLLLSKSNGKPYIESISEHLPFPKSLQVALHAKHFFTRTTRKDSASIITVLATQSSEKITAIALHALLLISDGMISRCRVIVIKALTLLSPDQIEQATQAIIANAGSLFRDDMSGEYRAYRISKFLSQKFPE